MRLKLYLNYLNFDKYISEEKPANHVRNIDVIILASVNVWIYGDYMCKE